MNNEETFALKNIFFCDEEYFHLRIFCGEEYFIEKSFALKKKTINVKNFKYEHVSVKVGLEIKKM